MTKNVNAPLTDLAGNPLVESGGATPAVKDVLTAALINATAGEPTAADKYARYKLARKVDQGGEVEVTPEDLVLIKLVVGQVYGPLVVGQVFEWADS